MSAPSSRPRSTTLGWSKTISPSTTLLLVIAAEGSILLSMFGHASSLTFPSSPGNPVDSLTRKGFLGEVPLPRRRSSFQMLKLITSPLPTPWRGLLGKVGNTAPTISLPVYMAAK